MIIYAYDLKYSIKNPFLNLTKSYDINFTYKNFNNNNNLKLKF